MKPALSAIVAGMWRLHQWQLDVAARVRWIEAALALGITSFDHADIYGGYAVGAVFGAALAASPGCASGRRSSPSAASSSPGRRARRMR